MIFLTFNDKFHFLKKKVKESRETHNFL